ncbi:MAG: hypothetical protein EBW74_02905, partial [Betaproteobacteria bacterium]|nr:hypothetical protein [Betaproteobacteria bacterium]
MRQVKTHCLHPGNHGSRWRRTGHHAGNPVIDTGSKRFGRVDQHVQEQETLGQTLKLKALHAAEPGLSEASRKEQTRADPNIEDFDAWLAKPSMQAFVYCPPELETDAIGLNYTSGTTGHPKGVVVHHRGAYLNALSNVLAWSMPRHPVYLWTLPMFHCNGWCFPWTIAALAGVNVCLRKIDSALIFKLIGEHRVSHY